MTNFLAGIAALTLVGTVALPQQAKAAERQLAGITKSQAQVDEMSAQRRYHRRYYARRHWAPRRHFGPRYGYGYPHAYGYPAYAYPSYGYYRPGPFVSFGVGPFGFGLF